MPAKTEITRFTVIILLSLGGGMIIGQPLLMLLLGGVLYLGWHFYHLLRLSRLLSEGREIPSPPRRGQRQHLQLLVSSSQDCPG